MPAWIGQARQDTPKPSQNEQPRHLRLLTQKTDSRIIRFPILFFIAEGEIKQ